MKYVHYLTVLAIFWFGFSVNAETLNSNGGIGGTGASEEEEMLGLDKTELGLEAYPEFVSSK